MLSLGKCFNSHRDPSSLLGFLFHSKRMGRKLVDCNLRGAVIRDPSVPTFKAHGIYDVAVRAKKTNYEVCQRLRP